VEFDSRVLQDCLDRSREWKREHGFPLEVQRFLPLTGDSKEGASSAESRQLSAWQRIALDTLEQRISAFVTIPSSEGERLLGFNVEARGWALDALTFFLNLGEVWREVIPDLDQEPSLEAWRAAWRDWCQPRTLPVAEVESSVLQRVGYKLSITVPRRFFDRLRAQRSDALKGEAWLLAGSSHVRKAALLEIRQG
jgi:hypothetical protein